MRTGIASDDWQVRRDAVTRAGSLLRALPGPTLTEAVASLLEQAAEDRKFEVRGEVARVLADLRHVAFGRILARLQGDEHHLVVELARATLQRRTQREASERDQGSAAERLSAALEELAALHPPEVFVGFHEAIRGQFEQAANATVHDVSHQLSAVLEDVRAFCEAPKPGHELEQTIRPRLKRILEVVKYQAELAAPAPSHTQRVALREVVDEAIGTACQARAAQGVRDAQVACRVGRHLAVEAPRRSLVRALENLILNALRHGGAGVSVGAALETPDEVTLTIKDEGPGMLPSAQRVLLTGVATRHTTAGEHGWGLVIIHRFVTIHCRGRIEVRAPLGEGTTVSLRLPVGRGS